MNPRHYEREQSFETFTREVNPSLTQSGIRAAYEAGYEAGQQTGGVAPSVVARRLRRMADETITTQHGTTLREKVARRALREAADRLETGDLP